MSDDASVLCVLSDEQAVAAQRQLPELGSAGVGVAYQSDPDDALAELADLDPKVVLVGMAVGDMDGLEILAELFRKHPTFAGKVVVLPDEGDPFPPMVQFRDPKSGRSSTSESDLEQVNQIIGAALSEAQALKPQPAAEKKPAAGEEPKPEAKSDVATKPTLVAQPAVTAKLAAASKPSAARIPAGSATQPTVAGKPTAAKPTVANKPAVPKPKPAAKPTAATKPKPAAKPTAAMRPTTDAQTARAAKLEATKSAKQVSALRPPAVPQIPIAPIIIAAPSNQDANTVPAPPNHSLLKETSVEPAPAAPAAHDEAAVATQRRPGLDGLGGTVKLDAGAPAPPLADQLGELGEASVSRGDQQLVDSQGSYRLSDFAARPSDKEQSAPGAASGLGTAEPQGGSAATPAPMVGGMAPAIAAPAPMAGVALAIATPAQETPAGEAIVLPGSTAVARAPTNGRSIGLLVGVVVVVLLMLVVGAIVVAKFAISGATTGDQSAQTEQTKAKQEAATAAPANKPDASKPADEASEAAPAPSAVAPPDDQDPEQGLDLKQPVVLPLKFDHGAQVYTVADQARLERIFAAAKEAQLADPSAVIEFGGHTSIEGVPVANERLGALRADRVRKDFAYKYLVWKRTTIRSHGATQPLGGEPEHDRRVTIKLSH